MPLIGLLLMASCRNRCAKAACEESDDSPSYSVLEDRSSTASLSGGVAAAPLGVDKDDDVAGGVERKAPGTEPPFS